MNHSRATTMCGPLLCAVVSCVSVAATCSTALAQRPDDEPVVHLRTYYSESYLHRASLRDPEDRPFNSIWLTAKFYPGTREGGNQVNQSAGMKRQFRFIREKLEIEAHGGYVLHPTDWLDRVHWQQRADALERLIVGAELTGSIALDIEGYEFDGIRTPPPSSNNKIAQRELVDACRPIVEVLRRHDLSATIYPCGGRKFQDYTAAAIALGAAKLGDEYTFIYSEKLLDGKTISKEASEFWRGYFANHDPSHVGIPTIPGLYASTMQSKRDFQMLRELGVQEAWLFVDDKNWLRRRVPKSSIPN